MNEQLRPALVVFLLLTVITGAVYPAVVTLIAQAAFPSRANGSLIMKNGKAVGSELIGQPFDDPKYFWGRPSATSPVPNNGASSTGSNYGTTNPAQLDAVKGRVEALRKADSGDERPVPVELVTASGSGLDPHISPHGAEFQVPRVAKARGIGEDVVRKKVAEFTEGRTFGVLGEPRVNVLKLNQALESLSRTP
jgi:K+-transporting ATPase ATPase C chain